MKDKETILYDNTADYEKEDETREYLFDTYADEEGWECKEEISDKQVRDEIAMLQAQQIPDAWKKWNLERLGFTEGEMSSTEDGEVEE